MGRLPFTIAAIFVGVDSASRSVTEVEALVTFTNASSSKLLKRVLLRRKSCHPTEAEDTRRFLVGDSAISCDASALIVSSTKAVDDSLSPDFFILDDDRDSEIMAGAGYSRYLYNSFNYSSCQIGAVGEAHFGILWTDFFWLGPFGI